VRAAREFDMDGLKIKANPGESFEEISVLNSEEAVLGEIGGLPEPVQPIRRGPPNPPISTANDIAVEAAEHLQRNDWT